MAQSDLIVRRTGMHPATLHFADARLEEAYRHALAARPRVGAQLALELGLAVDDIDRWSVWLIRFLVVIAGISVLLFTFRSRFRWLDQAAVALTGVVAAGGLVAIMSLMPVAAIAQYYLSVVIVVFWTTLFPGIRFLYGLYANIAIVFVFYGALAFGGDMPEAMVAGSAFFLGSATVLASAEAYFRERRRRHLFEQAYRSADELFGQDVHSLYDRLTALPNRALLADRLDQAIVAARRDRQQCAGLYIDLDDFARLAQSRGRAAAEELLRIVGQRLRQAMRESDTVAYLGDDEYFVLARGVASSEAMASVAARALACIEEPVAGAGLPPVALHASIGVYPFPYPDCTADDIVYRAELAMRAAKRDGKHRYEIAGTDSPPAPERA